MNHLYAIELVELWHEDDESSEDRRGEIDSRRERPLAALKKVFLDTHVFVSGLLEVSADSACRDILVAQAASEISGGLIYDAHLAQIAQRSGCAMLVTANLSDFRPVAPHGTEILSPRQFVDRMA